ncbi:dihydrofolate reductase [Halalkalibacter hemicellulosilyticus]|uniref:Dihydrofolate reductase n=1 Tax=Halalkalibacter hemicellulosilyticusJCM 9152 TaxID=1236971 RepID=W4QET8_9BACI|nr:dihydrofolate reductase [Halalkalibacter hemicellulosilyticus]GAE30422.1 dihydrofolate reductase [Halalkalibacter hemicellulosilyticusJCM 9152]
MHVSLIVAMDKNRVIGKDNRLPWSIPHDWAYVMKKTEGIPIILGRKNVESNGRALPGRRNIVVTRNKEFTYPGCEIAHSVEEVFALCREEEEIFIFGGEQIYELFMPYVDTMYITKIEHEFEGDTFFPEVDMTEWQEISVEKGLKNDENPYDYYFCVYERRT